MITSFSSTFASILANDLTAFVRSGRLFRVVRENEADDCGRDTVEEFVNGEWRAVVIASLDWAAELERVLAPAALAA